MVLEELKQDAEVLLSDVDKLAQTTIKDLNR